MSDTRERSSIFKFLYIVLSIVTFPIFVVIYICRHPFWVLFFVLLIGGGIVYYPLSKGVEIDKVGEWYKTQYADKKLEIVTKAVESGNGGLVPSAVVEEVKKTKQKLEEEKKESLREKSENYNDKVVRDEKFEEVAVGVRKKGGFKKKAKPLNSKESVKAVIDEGVKAGGLGALFKKVEEEKKQNELVSENALNENPNDESMLELDALIGDIENNALKEEEKKIEDSKEGDKEVNEKIAVDVDEEKVVGKEAFFTVDGEVKKKVRTDGIIIELSDELVKVSGEVAKEEDVIKEEEVLTKEDVATVKDSKEVVEINGGNNVESKVADEVKEKVDDVLGAVDLLVKEVKDEVVNVVDIIEPIEDIEVEIDEEDVEEVFREEVEAKVDEVMAEFEGVIEEKKEVVAEEVENEIPDVESVLQEVEVQSEGVKAEVKEVVAEVKDVVKNEIPDVESVLQEVEVQSEGVKAEVKEVVAEVKEVVENEVPDVESQVKEVVAEVKEVVENEVPDVESQVKEVVEEKVLEPKVIEEISVEDVDMDIF